MTSLQNKISVVTGGGEGIGLALAKRLAREGATVVIVDITEEKGQAAVEQVRSNLGANCPPILALGADVSSREAVESMVENVVVKFGRIDLLINNAGIWKGLTRGPFWQVSTEEWKRVFAVNTDGYFFCTAAVAPHMIKQNGGRIVLIGSATIGEAQAELTHYTCSKAALIGLLRCAARDLGKFNISVNMVHPSITDTGGASRERMEARAKSRFIPRVAVPDDLTGIVAFLCGDDASYLTAQQIYVDGGFVLN
jgi:NAD(P)-dependent dehydrogenase (short-subunit alcohol dehydrogenase family)